MATNTITLERKNAVTSEGATQLYLWTYKVTVNGADAPGSLRLGLPISLPLEDPSKYPQFAELKDHRLLRKDGDSIQFVEIEIAAGDEGPYSISLLAPGAEDQFVPAMLEEAVSPSGPFTALNFATTASGTENATQVLTGPAAPSSQGLESAKAEPVLPYASEPFGVYQPLIGWRSALGKDRVAKAIANRVMNASRAILRYAALTDDKPIGIVERPSIVDRTGTQVGRQLASFATQNGLTPQGILGEREALLHVGQRRVEWRHVA
jgi:hypothetical protein